MSEGRNEDLLLASTSDHTITTENTSDHTITTEQNKDINKKTIDDDKNVDESRKREKLNKPTEAKTPNARTNEDHDKGQDRHESDDPELNARKRTEEGGEREEEKAKGGVIMNEEETVKGDSQQVLHFNLLNPELLSKQLEVADLNDDQTEELLLNAKKINAQLRKILRQQQLSDVEHSPPSRKSAPGHSPSRKRSEGKTSAPVPGGRSASPKRTSGGRRKGCDREMTSLPQIHNTETGHDRTKSGKSRKGSAKSRASSSRIGTRPEWDDRFIYS